MNKFSLYTHDTLNRPRNRWLQNNGFDSLRLTTHAIYGEEATDPKDNNLLGQLWQQYDESGKIVTVEFDFKGNLLSKKQLVISSTVLKTALDNYQTYLVDWTGLPNILGTQEFETSSEFDALNRVTQIILPENVNSERKEITPTYNRAGGLEKVHYDGSEYVNNIVYNAKGQRLLIAFGNDIMTRYVYDHRTFRLLRQKSEKFTYSHVGNTHTYTPEAGTKRQDDKYIYDLIGNIFNINIRTTACGVGGTDSLDRVFDYDPLYRVISGTGRENVSGGNYPFPGWDDFVRSSDPNFTQAYTRKYAYDKVGNIQQVKQLGTSGFTRDFSYFSNQNRLEEIEINTNSYSFTYDNCGNQLTENTTRQFEWDAANRLLLFKNQTGSSEPSVIAQYLYDSAGNRVKKIVRKQGGDYEIRTYIDGIFEHYTNETDEQNTIHIMDNQSRVATVRIGDAMGDSTPAIKYELENNIYSSMVVLDDVGAIVNTQEYYPFGETSFGSYGKKRYQYVGKERDEESGLYYYGARYYSQWIARFISCDPLSAKYAQLSPYNYSDNNPINDFDIDGMQNNNSEGSEQGEISNNPSLSINTSNNEFLNNINEFITNQISNYESLITAREKVYEDKNWGGVEKDSKINTYKERITNLKELKSFYDAIVDTASDNSLLLANIIYNEAGSYGHTHAGIAVGMAYQNRKDFMGSGKLEEPTGADISHYKPLNERFNAMTSSDKESFLNDFKLSHRQAKMAIMFKASLIDWTDGATHWISPTGLQNKPKNEGNYYLRNYHGINAYFPKWARSEAWMKSNPSEAKKISSDPENYKEIVVKNVPAVMFTFYKNVR